MLAVAEQLDEQDRAMPNERDQIMQGRQRAEELRAVADQFQVPSVQEALRRVAANCEKMADHAEALLAGLPPAESDRGG
jgi:hypothetical protein